MIAYKAPVYEHNANQRPENGDWSYSSLVGFLYYRPAALDVLDDHKLFVYSLRMIRSFATSETEQFYSTGKSRRLPPDIFKRAAMRLIQLNAATRIEDLRLPPSNKLETLTHDRTGQWSIRINDQWRVCFRFENGDAFDVEIVDYH